METLTPGKENGVPAQTMTSAHPRHECTEADVLRWLSERPLRNERAEQFARIPDHDVCLRTDPLLWRDEEAPTAYEYHCLILDEAQMVKNAASRAAERVKDRAHRIGQTQRGCRPRARPTGPVRRVLRWPVPPRRASSP